MHQPLDDLQVDKLLMKVNLNNTFLAMATGDQQLISLMKDTIEYQRSMSQKRENLVHAITHNVSYLADIHKKNNIDLKQTKEHLNAV